MKSRFKVALAQYQPIFGNISENIKKHIEWISSAKEKGADIVVFPELALSGYTLKDLASELSLRRDSDEISELADASKDIAVVTSFPLLDDDYVSYIAMGFFYDGKLQHTYKKVHPPTHGMFEELKYFGEGDSIGAVDTPFGRVGMMICRDIWHPEHSYILSVDGASIFVVSSAIPARNLGKNGFGIENSMDRAVSSIASSNQAWVITVNRVGFEDGITFLGNSSICSPSGSIIKKLPLLDESMEIVEIDMDELRKSRATLDFVRERKNDLILKELKRIMKK